MQKALETSYRPTAETGRQAELDHGMHSQMQLGPERSLASWGKGSPRCPLLCPEAGPEDVTPPPSKRLPNPRIFNLFI